MAGLHITPDYMPGPWCHSQRNMTAQKRRTVTSGSKIRRRSKSTHPGSVGKKDLKHVKSIAGSIFKRKKKRSKSRKSSNPSQNKGCGPRTGKHSKKSQSSSVESPQDTEKVKMEYDRENLPPIRDEKQANVSLNPDDYNALFWDGEVLCRDNSALQQWQMYAERTASPTEFERTLMQQNTKTEEMKARGKKTKTVEPEIDKHSIQTIGIKVSSDIPAYLYQDLL